MNTIVETVAEAAEKRKFLVTVTYNGVDRTVETNVHQSVQALLQHAINSFGSLPASHTLSLYDASGNELDDKAQVGDAGINPNARLLLRPGKVKGGCA